MKEDENDKVEIKRFDRPKSASGGRSSEYAYLLSKKKYKTPYEIHNKEDMSVARHILSGNAFKLYTYLYDITDTHEKTPYLMWNNNTTFLCEELSMDKKSLYNAWKCMLETGYFADIGIDPISGSKVYRFYRNDEEKESDAIFDQNGNVNWPDP